MDDLRASHDLARPARMYGEESRSRKLFARTAVSDGYHRQVAQAQAGNEAGKDQTTMTPIVAVGAFIFDREGRVLLVERGKDPGKGLWTVPGGRLEPRETLAQAVAREVREETGLIVEVGALACVVERMGDDFHFVILDYLARSIGGT